ncbi:polymorphic toxin-type HINT domain-containing protein [Streptomyces brevispora]|uniref:polymorphic toxin-type HINT domain-containing protein n=1 Tax=Streptomyces brevispora TaxID=887462 RepID=UPI0035DEB8E0
MLLANGTTKPISEVKVGDYVLTAEPGKKKQEKHKVKEVFVTKTDRGYVDVVVDTKSGRKTIQTTKHHQFYEATKNAWTQAANLKAGQKLQNDTGGPTVVIDTKAYTATLATYDLSIEGLHTYYVLAGATPVLVHNCNSGVNSAGEACACGGGPQAYSVAFEMTLDAADFGRSRSTHFRRANEALDAALQSDAGFAQSMDQLIPGIGSAVSSRGGRRTPAGWTWQHEPASNAGGRQGVMRLVPRSQHDPGSLWQHLLHPGGAGGYAEWAVPNGAPRNRR